MNGTTTLLTDDFDYLNLLSENNELTGLFYDKAIAVKDSLRSQLDEAMMYGNGEIGRSIFLQVLKLKAALLRQSIYLMKQKINAELDEAEEIAGNYK